MRELETLARNIIDKAFKDKIDKAGEPYTMHLYRVARKVATEKAGKNGEESYVYPEIYIIGLLHDLLEDCPEWNEQSLRQLFPNKITTPVILLTREKEEPYTYYIQRLINSGNQDALKVKLVDLEDNMNVLRLPELNDNDLARLRKYHNAYRKIQNYLEL